MRTPRWLKLIYLGIVLVGVIIALPNLFTARQLAALPSWLPKSQVTLGLDLQGGSHLVLEVDAGALKSEKLRTLFDDVRNTLRNQRVQTQSVRRGGDNVVVTINDETQRSKALELLSKLAAPASG